MRGRRCRSRARCRHSVGRSPWRARPGHRAPSRNKSCRTPRPAVAAEDIAGEPGELVTGELATNRLHPSRFAGTIGHGPGWRSSDHRRTQMAKAHKKLDELFHDTLKDIYFAEKKILSTLPKMAKAAHNQELKAAFEKHYRETEGHVERLEQVFAAIKQKPQGKTCAAIVGITDEGAEIMEDYKGSPALDAGLLAAAQAVEHYQMSRY